MQKNGQISKKSANKKAKKITKIATAKKPADKQSKLKSRRRGKSVS